MNKNTRSANRAPQKNNKHETSSQGKMRFFYVLTLLVMILSLFLRVSGARPGRAGKASGGTAARILVFHQNDARSCADLTISAAGNAVFSNCGKGVEKQYTLNNSERSQLQNWSDQYGPVNYEHSDTPPNGGLTTRLYLNGRGSQPVDDAETRQMIDFARTLTARIAAQP